MLLRLPVISLNGHSSLLWIEDVKVNIDYERFIYTSRRRSLCIVAFDCEEEDNGTTERCKVLISPDSSEKGMLWKMTAAKSNHNHA